MTTRFDGIGMTSQRTRDRLIERLRAQGIGNPTVLEVIRRTPRHLFVDEALASRAYEDTALPIGHGQTISQPYIVARMTELLIGEGSPRRVLEIGTGCAYQTAVLAQLVPNVFSVDSGGPCCTRPGSASISSESTTRACGWPTARSAGPSMPPMTASWWPLPLRRSPRRSVINWLQVGAWSPPLAQGARNASCSWCARRKAFNSALSRR